MQTTFAKICNYNINDDRKADMQMISLISFQLFNRMISI